MTGRPSSYKVGSLSKPVRGCRGRTTYAKLHHAGHFQSLRLRSPGDVVVDVQPAANVFVCCKRHGSADAKESPQLSAEADTSRA